jgi:chromosome segregation ATPase
MAVERIDSIFDLAAIQAEYDRFATLVKDSYEQIAKLQGAVKSYNGSTPGNLGANTAVLGGQVQQTSKTQNELAAAKEKLNKLYTDEAQRIAAVNLQINEQRKANTAAAKQTLGLVDAYGKLNAQYIEAQRQAKNLAAAQGSGSKAAQEAAKHANELSEKLKAIDKTVGQSQRNVGNYAEGFKEGLGGIVGALTPIALGAATVEKAFDFFKESVKEFEETERAVSRLRNILDNVGKPELLAGIVEESKSLAEQFKVIKDEDVTEVFGKLATYGGLTRDQMSKLVPVIIDFATKSGKSLDEATQTVEKSAQRTR